eukprot:8735229-Pyramimonas_sp.AAC.1
MYTVVYNPEYNLKPQDVPASKVDFQTVTNTKLGAVHHRPPKAVSEPKTYIQAMSLLDANMWDFATQAEMDSIDNMN